MHRTLCLLGVSFGALVVSACNSDVSSTGGAGGSAGSGVDQKCYDACVAKGTTPDDCTAYCSDSGKGGKGSGSGGTTGKGGNGGAGAKGSGGAGTTLDPDLEKSCIQCWYDEAETNGTCAAEAEACDKSLACTQLQWCPILCGKAECLQECNDIIPTGVEPLTALVQCMACDGGPCAAECQDSIMLAYCE